MYFPTTRVLTVLELLQSQPLVSGPTLAARLEVDRRTVRRYIAMLLDLGIPVEAVHGRSGGYRLRPGFKLPPLMFTNAEALAVVLSLLAAQQRPALAEQEAGAQALAKIMRVLPDALRAQVGAVQAATAISASAAEPQPHGDLILRLGNAVQQQRRVQLNYESATSSGSRLVDPYGLVQHWGRWYLVGWCHLRAGLRVFRVDRIDAAHQTDAPFARPAEFDSLAYVLASLATGGGEWQAEVLFDAPLDAVQRRFGPGTATLEERAGRTLLQASVTRLEWLARELLAVGYPFTVKIPLELRAALRAVAAEALAAAERSATE